MAQLVARFHGMDEVGGSNPPSSTRSSALTHCGCRFLLPGPDLRLVTFGYSCLNAPSRPDILGNAMVWDGPSAPTTILYVTRSCVRFHFPRRENYLFMRPNNARRFMIAALTAGALVAGTVIPAHATPTSSGEDISRAVAAAQEHDDDFGEEFDGHGLLNDGGDERGHDGPKLPIGSWSQDANGWRYSWDDGTHPSDEALMLDGEVYRFDSRGYMLTGWLRDHNQWVYHNPSGAMAMGWAPVGGSWYYLEPLTGYMLSGWVDLDGTWYYMNASGAMVMGWHREGSTWYYLNTSGAMATGWNAIGGSWYYFTGSGAMATGWIKDGQTWYYANASGAMVTGMQWIGGELHWFYNSGAWWGLWQ